MRKNANAELAEDLVQEAMIAVWNKAGLYEPGKGSVTTWIFTIARNLRIDRIRRDVHMPIVELGDYDEASDDPPGDEVLARKQEDFLVSKALRRHSRRTEADPSALLRRGHGPERDRHKAQHPAWNRQIAHASGLWPLAPHPGDTTVTPAHHLDHSTILAYAAGTLDES